MDLHHLHYFIAVAEELSFRRAAERLHLSRPPLTRQIKALEKEVGALLLVRDGRRAVRLTDAGQAFLKHAKGALQKVQAAGDQARQAARGTGGVLRLAGCPVHSPAALNVYLPEFRRRYPAVGVTFKAANRSEELLALRDGRVHLSISADFGEALEPSLESKVIADLHLAAVLSAKHPLARQRGTQLDLRALEKEVFLQPVPQERPAYFGHLDEAWTRTVPTPRDVHTVDGRENVLAMVAAGYGVTVLSGDPANASHPGCRVKRLRLPPPSYRLRMVWLKSPSSTVLRNFLKVSEQLSLPNNDFMSRPR